VLLHEYGHARQPNINDVLGDKIQKLANAGKRMVGSRRAGDRIRENLVSRIQFARQRAKIATQLTAERDATLRGAEVLKRAGAEPAQIADYFSDIHQAGVPMEARRRVPLPGFDLMNASYRSMYALNKSMDPRTRLGGKRLIPPRFGSLNV
jgi:hypothetical protein